MTGVPRVRGSVGRSPGRPLPHGSARAAFSSCPPGAQAPPNLAHDAEVRRVQPGDPVSLQPSPILPQSWECGGPAWWVAAVLVYYFPSNLFWPQEPLAAGRAVSAGCEEEKIKTNELPGAGGQGHAQEVSLGIMAVGGVVQAAKRPGWRPGRR